MDIPECVRTQRAVIVRSRALAMVSLIVVAAATGASAVPPSYAFTSSADLKTAVDNCLVADPTGACDCSQPSVNCGAAGSYSMDQWDTSLVTDMSGLFSGYWNFNHDISSWDTSQVTDMSSMFSDCAMFNFDIRNWNVNQVRDMSSMFSGCDMFSSDLGDWVVNAVTDMSNMFQNAQSFNWDTLDRWDVSSVTDMSSMFENAYNFIGESLSSWNTGGVRNMNSMFRGAQSFSGTGIGQWNVRQVTDMSYMFEGTQNFAADILNWETRDGVVASEMFMNAILWWQDYFNNNQGSSDGPPNTWCRRYTRGCNEPDRGTPTAAIIAGGCAGGGLIVLLLVIYYWNNIRSGVRGGIDEVAQVQKHAKVRMAVGRKTVRAHSRRRQSKRADAIRTRDVESGNQSASEGSDASKKIALPPNRREHRVPIRAPVTPARFASTVTLPGQRYAAPPPVVVVLQSPQVQAQAPTPAPNQPTPNASATNDAKE